MIMFPLDSSFPVYVYAATGTGPSYTILGFALPGTRKLLSAVVSVGILRNRPGVVGLGVQHQMLSCFPHLMLQVGKSCCCQLHGGVHQGSHSSTYQARKI